MDEESLEGGICRIVCTVFEVFNRVALILGNEQEKGGR